MTIDNDFLKNLSDKQDSNSHEVANQPAAHQNNNPKVEIIFTPEVVEVDKSSDTIDIPPNIKKEHISISCQTEDSLRMTDLQDFKKSTVASLQDSFVDAFDSFWQD